MSDEMTLAILDNLLVASLVASCFLILISAAIVGRKVADRDYQQARGINGTMLIQGAINIRTHSMRVLVGVTFGVFAILLLADAPMLWRQWVNRILFVALPAGYVVCSALDWLAERQQLQIEVDEEEAGRAARARTATEQIDLAAIEARIAAAVESAVARTITETAARTAVAQEAAAPAVVEATAATVANIAEQVAQKMESVDVATIQEPAVQAIVEAVKAPDQGEKP